MEVKNYKFVEKGIKIPHSKIYHYDVVILGGGPAGLSAAIYSARYGLDTIIISKDIGGMANKAEKIENYPGFEGSGIELMKKFYNQARKFGAEFLNDDIISMEKDENGLIVAVSKHKMIHTKSLIIALGTQKRKLNVPGEDKFLGKGVSYCAICDANFFKNKDVAVIGGGDSACHAALLLSNIARKVYFIHRGKEVKCEHALKKKLKEKDNVDSLFNTSPMKIKGNDVVSGLIVWKDNKEMKLKVDGVFIEIGGLPLSDIAKLLNIKLDKDGYIHVDEHMQTDAAGIFAAGDVVKSKLKQIIVAASQGAMAAKSAYDYIQNL